MSTDTDNRRGMEVPSIDLVIERIDERLQALGLNDREASMRATGYPDAIREVRRRKRPGSARFVQLAKALETTPDYLGGWVDHQRGKVWMETTQSVLPLAGAVELPRDIPVYGAAVGGDLRHAKYGDGPPIEQILIDFSKPIDLARRPPRLTGRDDIYCLIVIGKAMYPRFREGDTIYVDPRRFPLEGDDAVILYTEELGLPERTVMIREFRGHITPDPKNDPFAYYYQLGQFTPPHQFEALFTRHERHRVIPWGELLSL